MSRFIHTLPALGLVGAVAAGLTGVPHDAGAPDADPRSHAPYTQQEALTRTYKAADDMLSAQVHGFEKSDGLKCYPPLKGPKDANYTTMLVRNRKTTGDGKRQFNTGVVRKTSFQQGWGDVLERKVADPVAWCTPKG
ncbi:hypothetical protein [Terracoccus sp. 273MFTsu3.1]|uniref:hypothetical protein n=1 Tax=Terracoccus sp. 273MFTsu3.1 TaxID=1172188 RepID=UPI000381D3DE|nr:hypothetical protein [Terracoccus sp. 273MFTsu3.1]